MSASVVRSVLKSSVDSLVRLADAKCGRGSANAITIGGANAQAANVVAAIFIATGQVCESPVRLLTDLNVCASLQDAAQVVSSSMCSTRVEATEAGDLRITCTMKCVEVGTVGGGTILEPQRAALRVCGRPFLHSQAQNILNIFPDARLRRRPRRNAGRKRASTCANCLRDCARRRALASLVSMRRRSRAQSYAAESFITRFQSARHESAKARTPGVVVDAIKSESRGFRRFVRQLTDMFASLNSRISSS